MSAVWAMNQRDNFSVNENAIKPQEDPCLNRLLQASILCNDSRLVHNDNIWQVRGDPTEGALVVLAAKAGINIDEEMQTPRVSELPFSSERKRMTTVHDIKHSGIAYSKGAPEIILDSCTKICVNGDERAITEADRKSILDAGLSMASSALRVLGLAYKPVDDLKGLIDKGHVESTEQEMVWLGLVGMIDPPRTEVKDAIKLCKQAGIQPVMITGDHRVTAEAIAGELGILSGDEVVLDGNSLDKLSQSELENKVENVSVYARVSAEHKMRVVQALQAKSQVVAMTGDGVNDAPALRKADIGIAMGITGPMSAKRQDQSFLLMTISPPLLPRLKRAETSSAISESFSCSFFPATRVK
jgi:Ca2+-transporting ATPase